MISFRLVLIFNCSTLYRSLKFNLTVSGTFNLLINANALSLSAGKDASISLIAASSIDSDLLNLAYNVFCVIDVESSTSFGLIDRPRIAADCNR